MNDLVKAEGSSAIEPAENTEDFENNYNLNKMLGTVGSLEFSDVERKILFKKFNPEDLDIKSTGIVYAPWVSYAKRLRDAFKGQWMLLPQGLPKAQGKLVIWPHSLIIKQKLVNYAVGECNYIASNDNMSYGDACEGAKSNALMRCCKGIGIGLEVWDKTFIEKWKKEYSETYVNPKGKTCWRRKDGTKKTFYIKLIDYLFDLLSYNRDSYLNEREIGSLEIVEEEKLREMLTELEDIVRKKFLPKGKKKIKQSEKSVKLSLEIQKMIDEKGKTKAWMISLLKKHGVNSFEEADEKTLEDIKAEVEEAESHKKK